MTPEKILQLLRLGESRQVEFRTSLKSTDPIGKNVCGLLNSSGGYIVCGVADDGEIVGVDISDAQLLAFEQKLHELLSPSSLVSVQRQELNGSQVVIIEVPKGHDVPYSFRNIFYIRSGETTQVASSEIIRDMVLASSSEPIRWERRNSLGELETDLDIEEVRRTVKDAERTGRAWFKDSSDMVRTLEDLSVARYGRMTNAGDVLFTKNPGLRLPQTRLRAYSYNSDKAGNKFSDMKSLEGPAMTLFEQAYSFIVRNTRTISRFIKGNPVRQDSPLYPEAAVREALINAFAHRDYSSASGGIAIHVFPRRLEIWNSGSLPPGVNAETLGLGQLSVLRNPDIAHVLYLRGLMEKAGRGSVLMVHECEKNGLSAPKWQSEENLGVTLTFFAPEVTGEVTGVVTGEVAGEVAGEVTGEVTGEVARLLAVINGPMKRQEIQDALGLKHEDHFREAYLIPALHAGLIEMTIPDKPTSRLQKYRLTRTGSTVRDGANS